ncbi:MAG TPA: PspA/IM30 family protein [Acidimicrobiia bacterium]|nr:PspA/IM30 family protein [Acidimicrobiia bacterium]
MLKRIWGYLKQLFRGFAESAMDPEVEIEQAISEARAADQRLRNQAAKVIAHRTQLESRIEQAASDVGEAREMAKQALLRAEEAKNSGDAEQLDKWTRAAQSLAMKIQAAESNLNGLKEQYEVALQQAEDAKAAVQQNAMRVQELAAKRMQLLGKLEQAKMQEAVNSAIESMGASLEREAPSLRQVEEKIESRLSTAKAHGELREVTPEGAERELREAVSLSQADAKLEELRQELGLN